VLVVAIESLRDAGRAALRAQRAVTVGTELEKSVVSLENGLRGYVATGRESMLAPFTVARVQYPRHVGRLEALAMDDPSLRAEARGIAQQVDDYVNLWALPLLSVARDDLEVARSVIGNSTGRNRVEGIRRSFDAMFAHARAEALRREHSAATRVDVAEKMGIAGIPLVIALCGLLAWLLRRGVVRPVEKVARGTETIAAGDYTARVPDDRQDELGDLARAFNAMAQSLESHRIELARRTGELERSNRELEDYASVTSHDLQGPLVTIGMYADLLARRSADDPEGRELAEAIRDGSARMRALVRDLLAYSRLDRRPGRQEPVSLEGTVREAREALAGPLRSAGAEVVVAGPLPIVTGDPARLAQLVQNLLSNAIKFTDGEPPLVEIAAVAGPDGMAQVTVADNGIGMSPEQTEVIFRPFHRLHTDERFDGTGIGLAVCQKIVDQHGGRIWAEGRPGEGATFHFTLPLEGAGHPDEGKPAAVAPGARV
jgi:signal transduction histidine kinase